MRLNVLAIAYTAVLASRNADFDKAAQAAVRGARFLPLPKAFPAASLAIELPFTYASKKHK